MAWIARSDLLNRPCVLGRSSRTVNGMATASNTALQASKSGVVIVGGGPAGIATALMLAKRGWKDITILERRSTIDFEEPERSYVYCIDGRGRKLTDMVDLSHKLPELGVETSSIKLARVETSGKVTRTEMAIKKKNRITHWMPRKSFLQLLASGLSADWAHGSIQLLLSSECSEVSLAGPHGFKTMSMAGFAAASDYASQPTDRPMRVTATLGRGEQRTWYPMLLVGADGLYSRVRAALDNAEPATEAFKMVEVPSASAGLRYKVMMLPPNPPVEVVDPKLKQQQQGQPEEQLQNSTFAIVLGALKGARRELRLGLLPVKDPTAPRPANIITRPDHEVWNVEQTAEAFYQHMEAAFPQLPVRRLIPLERAEQYARSKGGRFPTPQYCPNFFKLIGPSSDATPGVSSATQQQQGGAAVLLLGDAVHCFPPDLGQGVNSALEDVAVLHQALDETGDDLAQALPLVDIYVIRYQEKRKPDVLALIRLMQVSYPYQYNQDPLARFLWTINFSIRLALNKVLPFLIAPPSFLMIQDPTLSYREILARANRTTAILSSLLAAAVLAVGLKVAGLI